VIGGIGSIRGAFMAAIFVGMIDTLGRAFLPDLLRKVLSSTAASTAAPAISSMLIYLLMADRAGGEAGGAVPGRQAMKSHINVRNVVVALVVPWPHAAAGSYSALTGNIFILTLFTRIRHLRARRRQPQPHHGLWRHDEFWPCRLSRHRRLCGGILAFEGIGSASSSGRWRWRRRRCMRS
jgi:hypothetical protein